MYALDLAQGQRANGHRVLFVARAGTTLAHSLEERGIPHYCLRMGRSFAPGAPLELARMVQSQNIDLLHIHLSRDVLLSYLASKLSSRRVLKVLHKHQSVGMSKRDPLHHILYKDLDRTIAISQYVKRSLVAHCPLKDEDIEVIECGIDLGKWNAASVDRDGCRAEYGLSASHVLVGLVGRLDPRKGQEDFVRAAGLLSSRYPDLRFLVIGDSPDERYKSLLFSLSKQLGLEGRLIFTGHRPDIPLVMGGLDIVVAPSKEESFGLVAIEAMALRRPVIVTDRGAFPEFVRDGVTGKVVQWNDPLGLSRAIEFVLNRPEESEAMVERSHQLVRERFDLQRIVILLGDLYRLLLSKKGAR